jgi:hypothetical protein
LSTNFDEDPNNLISPADAARLRGVTRQAINRLICRGRFKIIVVAGRRFLLRSEVLEFRPEPPGRPSTRAAPVDRDHDGEDANDED